MALFKIELEFGIVAFRRKTMHLVHNVLIGNTKQIELDFGYVGF